MNRPTIDVDMQVWVDVFTACMAVGLLLGMLLARYGAM